MEIEEVQASNKINVNDVSMINEEKNRARNRRRLIVLLDKASNKLPGSSIAPGG